MQDKIALLALINLVFCPFVLVWQILYCFFNYAELIKREPGWLGVRKWSLYGRYELNKEIKRIIEIILNE